MRTSSNNTGIGQPVRRREDFRLLIGKGCYSDDFNLPGQAYAAMVRSPHAHARIRAIGTGAAKTAPDVLAVLTGRDLLADDLQPIPHSVGTRHPADIRLHNKDGSPPFIPPHYPMTRTAANWSRSITSRCLRWHICSPPSRHARRSRTATRAPTFPSTLRSAIKPR